jgi:zinc/manganese transport system permease protein
MHILAREVIFVDLSLAQLAALGGTVAMLFAHEDETLKRWFAFGFSALGAAIFALSGRARHQVSQEAIVGIVYAVSSAAMVLLLSRGPHGAEHIQEALVGTLLLASWQDVTLTAGLYAAIGLVHVFFRERFVLLSWRPDEADKQLKHVLAWDFGFYLLFALTITISVQLAGVLLVFSFLIVPAVITRLFIQGLVPRLLLGLATSLLASGLGLWASWSLDLPTGAAIVAAFGGVLLAAGIVRALGRTSGAPR